jgi:amidase
VNEVLFQSATAAAQLVAAKKISSRELTEQLLAHVDAANPALNAVVELRREAAMRDAAAADELTARGGERGPLHGVPMTIKESFHVAGMPCTWGNPAFQGFVADADAAVVRRLKQAGAILVGTTNVAFMLADNQTANELYGVTNNPWDKGRTPGGSSGGGAAALAAGMTFLEYGSDISASLRNPASFCGVYGLRPTLDIVPSAGLQPPGPPQGPLPMMYLPVVGPLARSAGDLRIALRATAGYEGPPASAYAWSLPAPRHTLLADFRVGFVLDDPRAPVSSEVGALLTATVEVLDRAGATVVEGWPEGVDPGELPGAYQLHPFFSEGASPEGASPEAYRRFLEFDHRRIQARAIWTEYFRDVDVFLCPANVTPAFPHDARPFGQRTIPTPEGEQPYLNTFFWMSPATLIGFPAAVAPVGRTPGGLPVGVQIVGPDHEDDTPITFAELLGSVVGGYERPPVAGPGSYTVVRAAVGDMRAARAAG